MNYSFQNDDRLGIKLPILDQSWNQYTLQAKEAILSEWEMIRGKIPDRIKELEDDINAKQEQLNTEENFERSCQLNSEIAELASVINDLWIWYRMNNDISGKGHE